MTVSTYSVHKFYYCLLCFEKCMRVFVRYVVYSRYISCKAVRIISKQGWYRPLCPLLPNFFKKELVLTILLIATTIYFLFVLIFIETSLFFSYHNYFLISSLQLGYSRPYVCIINIITLLKLISISSNKILRLSCK